jgi:hypothetical protein
MPHRNEQPTLFELTAFEDFEPPRGLRPSDGAPDVAPKSASEANASPAGPEVDRAVSPWAGLPLHEVCAACGREISGSGFVILDYEELGAFCDPDCGDRRFRSYLYEAPDERRPEGTAPSWT